MVLTKQNSQIHGLPLLLYKCTLMLSTTIFGQFLINIVDRLLWIMEKLSLWAVPKAHLEESKLEINKPLVRPLPWVIFLLALLILRTSRKGLSIVAWFFGKKPVAPLSVVFFIQARRRDLRTIKNYGLQAINEKQAKRVNNKGFLSKTMDLVHKLLCLQKLMELDDDQAVAVVVTKNNPHRASQKAKKPRPSASEDEDLTVAQLLDKYGELDNSLEDPDFIIDQVAVSEDGSSDQENSEPEDALRTGNILRKLKTRQNKRPGVHVSKKIKVSSVRPDQVAAVQADLMSKIQEAQAKIATDQAAAYHFNIQELQNDDKTKLHIQAKHQPVSPAISREKGKALNGTAERRRSAAKYKNLSHKTRGDLKHTNHTQRTPTITVSKTNNSEELFYTPIASPTPDGLHEENNKDKTNDEHNVHQSSQEVDHPKQHTKSTPKINKEQKNNKETPIHVYDLTQNSPNTG